MRLADGGSGRRTGLAGAWVQLKALLNGYAAASLAAHSAAPGAGFHLPEPGNQPIAVTPFLRTVIRNAGGCPARYTGAVFDARRGGQRAGGSEGFDDVR